MNLLAKKLNIKIKYLSGYTWNEYMHLLQTDKLDTIINISKNKIREKTIAFTQEYYQTRNAIIINKHNTKIKNIDDLNCQTVALPKNFFIQAYISKYYPQIQQKLVKNQLEALQLVSLDKATAAIGKKAVLDYLIEKHNISGLKYISYINDTKAISNLSIGTSKKDIILRNILNKAINSVSLEEINYLKRKWFGIKIEKDKNTLTVREINYLKNKKNIKICLNPNKAPIEFIDHNKPQGISVDVMKLVAKKLDMNLDFVQTNSWSQSQQYLKDEKCDIASSMINKSINSKYIKFTKPYLHYNLVLITKDNKPFVGDIRRILKYKIALKKGDILIDILKNKYPTIKIIQTNSYEESIKMVQNSNAYFTISTINVFSYYKKRYNWQHLQIAGNIKINYDLSIAIRDDDIILYKAINGILKNIPKDVYYTINDKWSNPKIIKSIDYTLIYQLLIVSLIIFIIIFIAYQKQKKLNLEIKELNQSLSSRVKEEVKKNQIHQFLMIRQSRLAQMGELISMIAHQWRQPLNNLALILQTIELKYKNGKITQDTMKKYILNANHQIEYMSNTIDDFREFFKPEKEAQEFCINDIIKKITKIIDPTLTKYDIKLNCNISKKLYSIGYPQELGQVIINIVNNAKDALIDTNINEKLIDLDIYQQEKYIIISIKNNGGTIEKKILDKIFEPYFSTKDKKNGTGLGLYMSKIIIEEHMDGTIEVHNNNTTNIVEFRIIINAIEMGEI